MTRRRLGTAGLSVVVFAVVTAVLCIIANLAARYGRAVAVGPPPAWVVSPLPVPSDRRHLIDRRKLHAIVFQPALLAAPHAPPSEKAPGHPLEPRRVIGKCQVQMFGDVSFGYMSYCFYSVQCRDSTPVCLTCSEAWSLPALEVPLLHTSRPPLPVQSDARVWLLTAPMP
jgi:hypothetical protein